VMTPEIWGSQPSKLILLSHPQLVLV
jgi:hypothetical protein